MSSYKKLGNYWCNSKENFFVGYAVSGPTLPNGLELGLPLRHPISGPVKEPSPLNSPYQSDLPMPNVQGIL